MVCPAWHRFESEVFHRFCESGPPPEILAALPAGLYMNAPVLLASCISTAARLGMLYRKGCAISVLVSAACTQAKTVAKHLKDAAMVAMSTLHLAHGTDAAKKLLSYKILKLIIDACDLVENFDPKKFAFLAAEAIGYTKRNSL